MGAAATRETTDAAPRTIGEVAVDVVSGVVRGAVIASGIKTATIGVAHGNRAGYATDYGPESTTDTSALMTLGAFGTLMVSALVEKRLAKVRALSHMTVDHIYTNGAITHVKGSQARVRISYLSLDDVFEIIIDGRVFTASAFAMKALLDAISAHEPATLCVALVQEATTETRARTWSVAMRFEEACTMLRVFRSVTDDLVDAEIAEAGDNPYTPYRLRLGVAQAYWFYRTWVHKREAKNGKRPTVRERSLVLCVPAALAASIKGLRDVVDAAAASTNVSAWFKPDRVLLLEN